MSMGGDSYGVTPLRRSSRPRFGTDDGDGGSSGSGYQPRELVPVLPPDESLPTYIGVGGGLSVNRVVKKLPQEIDGAKAGDTSLESIIKYVTSPEVVSSDMEKVVADAVLDRLKLADCRLLINNTGLGQAYNVGREKLQDRLSAYLVRKEQRTGTGTVEVNFCDISVVTHDEGGVYKK